jgi:hypothetical protein
MVARDLTKAEAELMMKLFPKMEVSIKQESAA